MSETRKRSAVGEGADDAPASCAFPNLDRSGFVTVGENVLFSTNLDPQNIFHVASLSSDLDWIGIFAPNNCPSDREHNFINVACMVISSIQNTFDILLEAINICDLYWHFGSLGLGLGKICGCVLAKMKVLLFIPFKSSVTV